MSRVARPMLVLEPQSSSDGKEAFGVDTAHALPPFTW